MRDLIGFFITGVYASWRDREWDTFLLGYFAICGLSLNVTAVGYSIYWLVRHVRFL